MAKRLVFCFLIVAVAALIQPFAHAQIIQTIAGTGVNGSTGDGGQSTSAQVGGPSGVAMDIAGNLYIASCATHRIRRVTPGGVISTIAGTGTAGFSGDGGAATSAAVSCPATLKFDGAGNLYFTDYSNHRVRRISTTGVITTVAGNGIGGFAGDGGAATSASLWFPIGIDVDNSGGLYIGDTSNHRVRRVNASGIISTLAGTGTAGFNGDGGPGTSAQLNNPAAVRVDSAGNVLIADRLNHRVRYVTPAGVIGTLAGNGTAAFAGDGGAAASASLNSPYGLALWNGDIYIGEVGNARVRRVAGGGIISTIAGIGVVGSAGDGGAPLAATIHPSIDITLDAAGNLIFPEQNYHRVRKVFNAIPSDPVIGTATDSAPNTVSVSFTHNGPSPTNSYTATCGTTSTVGTGSPIAVTGLLPGQTVTCRVTATNVIGTSAASAASNSVTPQGAPVFYVNSPAPYVLQGQTYTYDFYVHALPTATIFFFNSSAPPGFTIGSTTANKTTLQIHSSTAPGTYTYTLRANNAYGNTDSTHTVSVVQRASAPTITSITRANGSITINFTPPANNGGAPVNYYDITCSGGYISGPGGAATSATILVPDSASGSCSMTAYTAVGNSTASASVSFPAYTAQTIVFGNAPTLGLYGAASVSATGGASGNPVIFSSTTPAVCTTSGVNGATVTSVTTGTCTIAANQAGNANYQAAPQVTQSLVIALTQGAPNMATARANHTATLLADGRVLVVGGYNGALLSSAEIYNPVSGTWTATASLGTARQVHSATLLSDGRVLVAGGSGSVTLSSAEIFDPATQTWTAASAMGGARYSHTATRLQDGRVLVVGGISGAALSSTEIYDPVANTWSASGALTTPRLIHSATLLNNGDVLVVGGATTAIVALASIERFKPATNLWSAAGTLAVARLRHTATMLPNGLVLIAGGSPGSGALSSVERFDPATNTVAAAAAMADPHDAHTATLLTNGRVLIAGTQVLANPATVEAYDYLSNSWATVGTMNPRRHSHTATLLNDGRVLWAGGYAPAATNISELFAIAALPAAPVIGSATPGNASATVNFTPAYHIGLTPLINFTAASSPGGITGTCSAPCSSINITGLTNGTAYTFTVAAINGNGTSATSASSASVTPLGTQTITFGSAPSITVGGTGTVNATGGTSGNPVTFTSQTTSICTVSGVNGSTITGVSAGTCTIAANQAGNTSHLAAPQVTQSFSVTVPTYTVTPGAGANGTISPSTVQTVTSGTTSTFTVTPASGYTASVSSSCGGSLVGTTFTTNAVTANCTVTASFTLNTYTATASWGANGHIAPMSQTVNHGSTTSFSINPDAGYDALMSGSCGGTLTGNTFVTNAITANCSVSASFIPTSFTVTAIAGANGSISPATVQNLSPGSTASFTVTPNSGYFVTMGGTCGGVLIGSTYTTNAVTANCTVQASFVGSFVRIAAGMNHTLAIRADGTLWSWGGNHVGQLGDGTTVNHRTSPAQIGSASNWASVGAGQFFSVAIRTDGTLWAWGGNDQGQLGDGTLTNRRTPTQIGSATNWAVVAAGTSHALALRSDGTLWGWGGNFARQLGDGTTTNRTSPIPIGAGTLWSTISAGGFHSMAVRGDGALWGWGENISGQLGDGTYTRRDSPVQIGAATSWRSVAAGQSHTIALRADGTLWAWGHNFSGQLGNGTTTGTNTPAQIGSDTNWAAITAGQAHSAARRADGTLWVWGYNFYAQLGDGTLSDRWIPTQLASATNWTVVAAGAQHTTALRADDTLQAWGDNSVGQLGVGSNTSYTVPIVSLPAPVIGIATSGAGIASIAFTPLGSTYNTATQYIATSSPDGITGTCVVPCSYVVVTGLSNGTAYTFTVAAATASGVGASSTASNSVTPMPATFTVTPSVVSGGSNGSITPSAPQTVTSGATSAFTVTPNSGYSASVGGSCGGSLVGTTYTTVTVTGDCTVEVSFRLLVALSTVASRKTHGAAGVFEIVVNPATAIGGAINVDPRTIGSGHTIVFSYNQAITTVGTASATDTGGNPIGAANAVVNPGNANEVLVTLTGIPDASRVLVSVAGVAGAITGTTTSSAAMGFLVGDVNQSRSVNATDVSSVKSAVGQVTDATNFRFDVNASGTINATDLSAVKTRTGGSI